MDKIQEITHPEYQANESDWTKFRLTYAGGHDFVDEYLKAFSVREGVTDLTSRKAISYCPAHAKAALTDINNSIAQRMPDVTRSGGAESYKQAIGGDGSGVDREGNTIDGFMTRKILPELTSMGKVGVYIDREPLIENATKADTVDNRPYLYRYTAENIRSWAYNTQGQLTSLLLRDHDNQINEDTGLVSKEVVRYRLLRLVEDHVDLQYYDEDGKEDGNVITLDITEIPFVVFELTKSLLVDIADIQIALLNIASSDIMYTLKSNHPFYTEQYDPIAEFAKGRQAVSTADGTKPGEDAQAQTAKDPEIQVGTTKGRRYPLHAERPGFIHPSSEPLIASMQKQDQLKQEIRQLINLSLTNIEPKRASAESKQLDQRGMESGLANIGAEAEYGERQLANIWSLYEGKESNAVVKYPSNYSLKSDEDRQVEATGLIELLPKLPSLKYQKAIAKLAVIATIGHKISDTLITEISSEIDNAEVIVTDREVLVKDIEAGLVGVELASKIAGYPAGEVEKARKDHADRLARIQESQAAKTRGVDDTITDPRDEDDEKKKTQDAANDESGQRKTRGEEK